jgi:hypothetical protein
MRSKEDGWILCEEIKIWKEEPLERDLDIVLKKRVFGRLYRERIKSDYGKM